MNEVLLKSIKAAPCVRENIWVSALWFSCSECQLFRWGRSGPCHDHLSTLPDRSESRLYKALPELVYLTGREGLERGGGEHNKLIKFGSGTFALRLRNIRAGLEGQFDLTLIETFPEWGERAGADPSSLVVGEGSRVGKGTDNRLPVHLDQGDEAGVGGDVAEALLRGRATAFSGLELQGVVMSFEEDRALVAVVWLAVENVLSLRNPVAASQRSNRIFTDFNKSVLTTLEPGTQPISW